MSSQQFLATAWFEDGMSGVKVDLHVCVCVCVVYLDAHLEQSDSGCLVTLKTFLTLILV